MNESKLVTLEEKGLLYLQERDYKRKISYN